MSGEKATLYARSWRARSLTALGQVVGTAVVYSILNELSSAFQISGGVSIVFPATAIAILASMFFGPAGALGVFLGTILSPWGTSGDLPHLIISGAINALEGLLPYLVFRFTRSINADIRDVRSLLAFVVFGTIVNTGLSSVLGNALLISSGKSLSLSSVLIWWVADFTAATLLAVPFLAFAPPAVLGWLRNEPPPARSLANALQIAALTVLLGWSASAIMRNYLINDLESARLDAQQDLATASSIVNEVHQNFLFASGLHLQTALTNQDLQNFAAARRVNIRLLHDLEPYVTPKGTAFHFRYDELTHVTSEWFSEPPSPSRNRSDVLAMHQLGRKVLALKNEIELQNLSGWEEFARNRRTIMAISLFTDLAVFFILLAVSLQWIFEISVPLRRLHHALNEVRNGAPFDANAYTSRFLELETLRSTVAQTLGTLKRREEQLSAETARALAASRHKSEFLAKMSHELRTPLNSIVGFSELMLESVHNIDPVKRHAFLDNVSRSGRHLLALIDDLLDIARIDSGKISFEIQSVDVRYILESSASMALPLLREKQQELSLEMPQSQLMVQADPMRLQQVILNLLSNAQKFSAAGTRIQIAAKSSDSLCAIEVIDQGIGIAAEEHERIFSEFEQIHSRGANSRGVGLGLALARRFVEGMNGTISVRSALAHGATFEVRIPLKRRPGPDS